MLFFFYPMTTRWEELYRTTRYTRRQKTLFSSALAIEAAPVSRTGHQCWVQAKLAPFRGSCISSTIDFWHYDLCSGSRIVPGQQLFCLFKVRFVGVLCYLINLGNHCGFNFSRYRNLLITMIVRILMIILMTRGRSRTMRDGFILTDRLASL